MAFFTFLLGFSLGFNLCAWLVDALKFPWPTDDARKNGSAVSKHLDDKIRAPKGSPAADHLVRIVLALTLEGAFKEYAREEDCKRVQAAAASVGVDYGKIAKATAAELTAEFNKRKAKALAAHKDASKVKFGKKPADAGKGQARAK